MPNLPDYDSPAALKAFLEERGFGMQKKFGQNFLVNRAVRERLVDALNIEPGSIVWEIGPGLGSMTDEILRRRARLTAFEIDRGFAEALRGFFSGNDGFTLVEGDVLKTWKPQWDSAGAPDRLFGNLPYNIAATVIGDTIESGARFDRVVVTVQKEVALRMAAKPATEHYSSFSVLCQWAYDVEPLMDIAAGSFWPVPGVVSRAVAMTKRDVWPDCANPATFAKVLRALFSSRRKTVRNNLSAWLRSSGRADPLADVDRLTEDILASAGIDPGERAERLAVNDFRSLSDRVDERAGRV